MCNVRFFKVAVIALLIPLFAPPAAHADEVVPVNAGPVPVNASSLRAGDLLELRAAGLEGSRLTVQRTGGLILVTDQEGSWTVTEDETSPASTKVGSLSFGAGVCSGKFLMPKRVNRNVEWGAYETCATLGPSQVYVHSISAALRMQTGPFGINMATQLTAVSPLGSVYSKTVTAHRVARCPKTDKKNFDIVVRVTLKSVRFAPHVSGTVSLSCSFEK